MICVSNGAKRYLSLISYLREGTSLYIVTSIVQSYVELKVGCVKHNAGKNIRKLSYSGYHLTNYSSKKGYEEVNLAPYNTFDLCLCHRLDFILF